MEGQMGAGWFRHRGYRHLDAPVGSSFAANAIDPVFVTAHVWTPLLSYPKRQRRYKPMLGKTTLKTRTIMYASHRDACILSYYARQLTDLLDQRYQSNGLNDAVIAYRSLGKSNYNFAAKALEFAKANAPCVALCFDVTGFFDNIDHKILKRTLGTALGGTG